MSSTTGLRAGDLTNEVQRLRDLLTRQRREARRQRARAETWRQRALAAEWATRNQPERSTP